MFGSLKTFSYLCIRGTAPPGSGQHELPAFAAALSNVNVMLKMGNCLAVSNLFITFALVSLTNKTNRL